MTGRQLALSTPSRTSQSQLARRGADGGPTSDQSLDCQLPCPAISDPEKVGPGHAKVDSLADPAVHYLTLGGLEASVYRFVILGPTYTTYSGSFALTGHEKWILI